MAHVRLRPDLKTSGGEVSDILLNERYAGTLALVYREQDRIAGSVQLERKSLSSRDRKAVISFVQGYVQSMIDALKAEECEVVVTVSPYDHVIATGNNVGTIREFADADDIAANPSDHTGSGAAERAQRTAADAPEIRTRFGKAVYYELVIVGERRNKVEYHVYDQNQEWIAEAMMTLYGPDVSGEVIWKHEPSEEEIEHVTDLIVSDFDENEIDTFAIDMKYDGRRIETIQLTHKDLLNKGVAAQVSSDSDDNDYSILLTRDDGDALTYEIYQTSYGSLPIGTATIDISRRQLTGFIDFREPGASDDREQIAALLLRELEKEKDYDTFSLTMLYQNEPIDEIVFESEPVH